MIQYKMIVKFWCEDKLNTSGDVIMQKGWFYKDNQDDELEIEITDDFDKQLAKAAVNWILGPVKEYMNKNAYSGSPDKFICFKKLKDLIVYVEFTNLIDFSTAKNKIFPELINNFTTESTWQIMERLNVLNRIDNNEVLSIIDDVLSKNEDKVVEYKKGKVGLLSLFMGEVLKSCRGKVSPQEVKELVQERLK